jgi:hypothetical protein
MIPLKQSTAFTWKAGPFLDETDGKTAEPALSIAQADIRLSKNGGDTDQSHNAAGATHDEGGDYDVPLDTTDTATLGHLRAKIHKAGALPVWENFMVFPANVFDSFFSTDNLQVDVVQLLGTAWATPATSGLPDCNVLQISGDAGAADNLEAACDGGAYNLGGGAVVAASVTAKTGYALTSDYDAAKTAASQSSVNAIDAILDNLHDTDIPAIKAKTDNLPAFPAAVGSAMTLTAAYDAAKTAASQSSVDANGVKLVAVQGKTDMLPAVWFSP